MCCHTRPRRRPTSRRPRGDLQHRLGFCGGPACCAAASKSHRAHRAGATGGSGRSAGSRDGGHTPAASPCRIGRVPANVGPMWPNSDRHWTMSSRFCPRLAELDQTRPDFGQHSAETLPKSAKHRPNLANIGQDTAHLGQHLPNLGRSSAAGATGSASVGQLFGSSPGSPRVTYR